MLRIDQYISLGVTAILIAMMGGVVFTGNVGSKAQELRLYPFADLPVALVSNSEISFFLQEGIGADAVMVQDLESGVILMQKNEKERRAPASTTKLMTALVARRHYPLAKVVSINEEAFTNGTTVGFKQGERWTIESLLKALLISSANDAAFALANNFPQNGESSGYVNFVKNMNLQAKSLYLSDTNFHNPSGLDEVEHYSNARDLIELAKEVLRDEDLAPLVASSSASITDEDALNSYDLFSTNELLFTDERVFGVKTGTTEEAGQVLISGFRLGEHRILIIVMGSENRYADTKSIVSFIERNFDWQRPRELGYTF